MGHGNGSLGSCILDPKLTSLEKPLPAGISRQETKTPSQLNLVPSSKNAPLPYSLSVWLRSSFREMGEAWLLNVSHGHLVPNSQRRSRSVKSKRTTPASHLCSQSIPGGGYPPRRSESMSRNQIEIEDFLMIFTSANFVH